MDPRPSTDDAPRPDEPRRDDPARVEPARSELPPGGRPPRDRRPDATPAPDAPVAVDVERTGGFAGISRRWSAQPPPDEADEWIALIDRCPWDAASAPPDDTQPDTFTWCIRAHRTGAPEREAELPDDEVTGAWRELIDAVREWNRATGRTAPRPR